jgi:hypothetical protein
MPPSLSMCRTLSRSVIVAVMTKNGPQQDAYAKRINMRLKCADATGTSHDAYAAHIFMRPKYASIVA